MNLETKKRIEQIKEGIIPEGYVKSKIRVLPEEWDVVHLEHKFNRLARKNLEDNQNVLTISAQQGLISQEDYYKSSYASENKKDYSLLYKGDFSYNKSYSSDYLYGAIKRLDKYDKGIVSPLYICFEAKEETNSEFYIQYFESGLFNGEIYKIAQEGARNHGLLNVSISNFFKSYIVNPNTKEQQKISEILQHCDKVIELKQKLIDELNMLKKVYLSKMFPKKGSNVPEMRFEGFTDAWEQRKLNEVAEFNPKSDLPQVFEYVDLESVVGTEMIAHREENRDTAPSRAQRLAKYGDLFYQTVRPYQKNNYLFEKPYNNYVFSTGYAQIRPCINGYFLLCLVQNEYFVKTVLDNCTGTSYPAINSTDLSNIDVYIPKETLEQTEIGEFFRKLDNLITLHQRELEEKQKLKKSLMQLLLTGIVRCKV